MKILLDLEPKTLENLKLIADSLRQSRKACAEKIIIDYVSDFITAYGMPKEVKPKVIGKAYNPNDNPTYKAKIK